MTTTYEDVCQAVRSKRHRYANEVELHHSIAETLNAAHIDYEREVQVVGGRIDFLIGRVGVEVKIKGGPEALLRQVTRYAEEPRISRILVVTTRSRHRVVHGFIHDVPVDVLVIGALT